MIMRRNTLGGILAILLWSTTIAFSRGLIASIGVFSAGAFCFLTAGLLGLLWSRMRKNSPAHPLSLPPSYLLSCGAVFVAYQLCLYLAVGLAPGGAQVVEVGIINYLWPVLTLVLSIPMLRTRARLWVIPGFLLALAGTVLAVTNPFADATLSPASTPAVVPILALVAAVTWALYSNFARRHAGSHQGDAVPLFFLASGSLMLALRSVFAEHSQWSTQAVLTLCYMALCPNLIAYTLWDKAMRRGDIVLVTVLSYFTPLLSTAVTCVCLKVWPGWNVWAACGLLIAGALLSRWSLKAPEQQA
ncbi:MAG: aromatic amino acid DMT transporter YddG [Planctomycetota bacterium]|nr:aromatic amino acid DMT transporter YddG [Planctomycetota bacterium]